jgi:hypothetical protein
MPQVLVSALDALDSQGRQMLEDLQDRDLYRWIQLQDDNSAMGRSHSLIHDITRWGDVVVIEFTPMGQLARHVGDDARWLVQGFVNRLQTPARSGSAVVTANSVANLAKNTFNETFNSAFHGTFDGFAPYVEQMKALKREFDALDIRTPSLRTTLQEVA